MLSPDNLSEAALRRIVRGVQAHLWKIQGESGFNPHKEWDSDTAAMIAVLLTDYGLAPTHKGDNPMRCD